MPLEHIYFFMDVFHQVILRRNTPFGLVFAWNLINLGPWKSYFVQEKSLKSPGILYQWHGGNPVYGLHSKNNHQCTATERIRQLKTYGLDSSYVGITYIRITRFLL